MQGKTLRVAQTVDLDFWSLFIFYFLSVEETDMVEFRTYWRKFVQKVGVSLVYVFRLIGIYLMC